MDLLEKLNTIISASKSLNERRVEAMFPKAKRVLTPGGEVSPSVSSERIIDYINHLSSKSHATSGIDRMRMIFNQLSNIKKGDNNLSLYLIAKQIQLSVLSPSRGITMERIIAGMMGAFPKMKHAGPEGGSVDIIYESDIGKQYFSIKSSVATPPFNLNSIIRDFAQDNEWNAHIDINNISDFFINKCGKNEKKFFANIPGFKEVLENFYVIYIKLEETERRLIVKVSKENSIYAWFTDIVFRKKDAEKEISVKSFDFENPITITDIDDTTNGLESLINSTNKNNIKTIYRALQLAQQIDEETQDAFVEGREKQLDINKSILIKNNTEKKADELRVILGKLSQ